MENIYLSRIMKGKVNKYLVTRCKNKKHKTGGVVNYEQKYDIDFRYLFDCL